MSIGLPKEESPFHAPPSPGHSAILVVDEDPAFQLGLKTFLREYVGFEEVFTARDGEEALGMLAADPEIEMVTLDYQMPGLDGIEFLRRVSAEIPRPLSVTMITGYPSEELESEFRSFASPTLLTEHFLPKPVEFERLEPLMLEAHESLAACKRRLAAGDAGSASEGAGASGEPPEAEGGVEGGAAALSLQIDEMRECLAAQEAAIEDVRRRLGRVRRQWRTDFLLVALLAAAVWAGYRYDWIAKAEPGWLWLKESVAERIEAFGGEDEPAATAPVEGEEPQPESEPAREGQPL